MDVHFRAISVASLFLAIAGCGGGGGGSGSGNSVRFDPPRVEMTVLETQSKAFRVRAVVAGSFSGDVYARIVDSAGVTAPGADITENSDGSYRADFLTSSALSAGVHRGDIRLQLCRDEACSSQYPGSPFRLPYVLTVQSHTNLKPLAAQPGVAEWESFQGGATHSGYAPLTLNPAQFSPRWLWRLPEAFEGGEVSTPVIVDGRVFINAYIYSGTPYRRSFAIGESDGSTLWARGYSQEARISAPAVSSGKAWVMADEMLNGLDVTGGGVLSQAPLPQFTTGGTSPTLEGGRLFTSVNGEGLRAYSTESGALAWSAPLEDNSVRLPAVQGSLALIYRYAARELRAFDKTTGAFAFAIPAPVAEDEYEYSDGLGDEPLAVSKSGSAVVVTNGNFGRVVHLDLVGRRVDWQHHGERWGYPAVANGTVYVVGDDDDLSFPGRVRLHAYRESDGVKLWSWPETATPASDTGWFPFLRANVVATDNLVFVSTDTEVHAIDTSTHKSVWSYPWAGSLAISSSGVLYVRRFDIGVNSGHQDIAAINLR